MPENENEENGEDVVGVAEIDASTYYGCIPYDKSDTVVVTGGAESLVEFQLTDSSGNPLDLSLWFCDKNPHTMGVRFSFADNSVVSRNESPVMIVDASLGKVQFLLPEFVTKIPCIYYFYFGINKTDEITGVSVLKHVCPSRGLLLVEWSPWMEHVYEDQRIHHKCVPTLKDVRRKLDDFASKNTLLKQVEFSADDIVHAMLYPLDAYNDLFFNGNTVGRRYSLTNFPYYEQWVTGTAGELMQIASLHYTRNKMMENHGGIQGDEMNRDTQYLQISQMLKQEYMAWLKGMKQKFNYRNRTRSGTISTSW
jgi:hypothetical protein